MDLVKPVVSLEDSRLPRSTEGECITASGAQVLRSTDNQPLGLGSSSYLAT